MSLAAFDHAAAEPLRSILIVDPDPDARWLYRIVLDGVATTFHEAEDGAEALGKALCQRPEVVVTSARLRRIDGYSLCQLLRREAVRRDAAIVMITGGAYPAQVARAAESGADEVLLKPCLPDAIREATVRSLRRRTAAPTLG